MVLAEWILRQWSSSNVNLQGHLEGEHDSTAPAASSGCLHDAPGLHASGELATQSKPSVLSVYHV